MDDNNNSAVSTTPAAAGGTPPPEGATPTPEQQTTFQKWLAGLFGGKETAPAGQESDPAADKGGSQEPQGKTYTEAGNGSYHHRQRDRGGYPCHRRTGSGDWHGGVGAGPGLSGHL